MARQKKVTSQRQAETRQRILRAFSERAKRSGIRSVVMSELASELRISPNTLYQHFRSKNDLVIAMVQDWARESGASDAARSELKGASSAVEGMVGWAEAWAKSMARYAPAFWEDLRRDHAEAFAIFRGELRRRKELGAAALKPHLRPELHPDIALAVLNLILTRASDPSFSESRGATRQETIRTAVGIWARGALRERAQIKVSSKRRKK